MLRLASFICAELYFRLPLECWHAGANIGQPETIIRAPYGLLASRALA
ncbi:hypothetical protein [Kingella oralis]